MMKNSSTRIADNDLKTYIIIYKSGAQDEAEAIASVTR